MCCWDCSYLELSCGGGRRKDSGQLCLSCMHSPPRPVCIPPVDPDQFHGQLDWSRTEAAAPLCHLDCSFSSLTPCKPSWDWGIQMNSGVWRELPRRKKESRWLWLLHISLGRTGLSPTLFLQDSAFFIQVSFCQNSIKVTHQQCGSRNCRGAARRAPPRPVCLRAPELQCLSLCV